MASVGNGQTGRTLIGTGVTSSPTFASIGTLSGLTQFGVILGGGSGAFTSTSAGAAGYVLTSSGPGSAPVFSPASVSGISTLTGNSGGAISPSSGNINVVGTGSTTVSGSGSTLTVQMTGLTNHSLLVGAGTATITKVGPTATSGQVLQSSGASADPVFSTATYPSSSGGSGKIIFDNGTNFIESTPTFPASASATSRKIIVSDGTNWVASTETWAVPGTSGNVLQSDGTNWTSAAPTGGFAPNSTINLVDDFIGASTSVGVLSSQLTWQDVNTTFVSVSTTSSSHPGIVANTALTASFAELVLQITSIPQIVIGGGAISINWVIDVATLSTGTNTYTLIAGLADIVSAEPTNGVYFLYTNATNSGQWVGKTANASSRSSANSSVTVTAGSFVNLGITINAAATSCAFFVNGVQISNSPIATNIPTIALRPFISMVWSAGTVPANSVLIDLFYMTQTLTTPR